MTPDQEAMGDLVRRLHECHMAARACAPTDKTPRARRHDYLVAKIEEALVWACFLHGVDSIVKLEASDAIPT